MFISSEMAFRADLTPTERIAVAYLGREPLEITAERIGQFPSAIRAARNSGTRKLARQNTLDLRALVSRKLA